MEKRVRKQEEHRHTYTFYIIIFTFILNKTTDFKGKEDFMIEFIVMFPFLSGNISVEHEVDSGGKPELKKMLSFGCPFCLITDIFYLKMAAHVCGVEISSKGFCKDCIPVTNEALLSIDTIF